MKARGAQGGRRQPGAHRLQRRRRRLDRHHAGHRRALGACAGPLPAARRPDRPGLPGALDRRALPASARRRAAAARRGRQARSCIDRATGAPAPFDTARASTRTWRQGRTAPGPSSATWRNATWQRTTRRRPSPSAAASPPPASARSPPRSPMWPSEGVHPRPALDRFPRRDATTIPGRPVAIHAMRGISAHANGFQTCRAIHLLQLLVGIGRGARRLPLQAALSQAGRAPIPRRMARLRRAQPLDGPHLGLSTRAGGPAAEPDGSARRIDKAFTWENPMSAHGLMHMVISNAHAGDPYAIDTLFLYMANMAWNSSMNAAGIDEDADRHRRNRRLRHPAPDLFGRLLAARWWPMPTWCCPTRPIWNATTASRCSTGRSARPRPPPTRSAGRWSTPDRRRAGALPVAR